MFRSFLLKSLKFMDSFRLWGRLFQMVTARKIKDFCPVLVLNSGICSFWQLRVDRPDVCSLVVKSLVRYSGAQPAIHLKVNVASRRYSCCLTGIQRKSLSAGVIWSNFLTPQQILAALRSHKGFQQIYV